MKPLCSDAFSLWLKGDSQAKVNEEVLWDIHLIQLNSLLLYRRWLFVGMLAVRSTMTKWEIAPHGSLMALCLILPLKLSFAALSSRTIPSIRTQRQIWTFFCDSIHSFCLKQNFHLTPCWFIPFINFLSQALSVQHLHNHLMHILHRMHTCGVNMRYLGQLRHILGMKSKDYDLHTLGTIDTVYNGILFTEVCLLL